MIFKRGNSILKLFLFILLIFCLLYSAYAAMGVSPAYYDVDFKPNLKQEFIFNFFTDQDNLLELYVIGDLSQYAKLNKKILDGRGGQVEVSLKLPNDIEIPGVHSLSIGAKEKTSDIQGFGITADVRGSIRVKVPYPGRYATSEMAVESVKAGEPVEFKIKVNNLGRETFSALSYILVSDDSNMSRNMINLEEFELEPTQCKEITAYMNTSEEKAGDYHARLYVNYGGKNPAISESSFSVGKLFVEILNYTERFVRNDINKFEVGIKSRWNDPIQFVWADVSIPLHGIKFSTPSVLLDGFGEKVLTGYFDTSGIPEEVDEFKAKIVINYEGMTTEKIVLLKFEKVINYWFYAMIGGIILLVVIAVVLTIWIRRIIKVNSTRVKKNAKKK